jgi:hypothetical protein
MTEIFADAKLQEVMERTMWNLRYIHEHRAENGPFEVVQLVNSFSGAMVHPWEAKRGNALSAMKTFSLSAARAESWPVLEKELPTDADPANYHEMLNWTRNAFAHGNVDFQNHAGQIASIRIWNCPHKKPRNWGAVVSVDDMEDFLWFFCDLASGRRPKPIPNQLRIISHAAD